MELNRNLTFPSKSKYLRDDTRRNTLFPRKSLEHRTRFTESHTHNKKRPSTIGTFVYYFGPIFYDLDRKLRLEEGEDGEERGEIKGEREKGRGTETGRKKERGAEGGGRKT